MGEIAVGGSNTHKVHYSKSSQRLFVTKCQKSEFFSPGAHTKCFRRNAFSELIFNAKNDINIDSKCSEYVVSFLLLDEIAADGSNTHKVHWSKFGYFPEKSFSGSGEKTTACLNLIRGFHVPPSKKYHKM